MGTHNRTPHQKRRTHTHGYLLCNDSEFATELACAIAGVRLLGSCSVVCRRIRVALLSAELDLCGAALQ
jgi:hypothetical protein